MAKGYRRRWSGLNIREDTRATIQDAAIDLTPVLRRHISMAELVHAAIVVARRHDDELAAELQGQREPTTPSDTSTTMEV